MKTPSSGIAKPVTEYTTIALPYAAERVVNWKMVIKTMTNVPIIDRSTGAVIDWEGVLASTLGPN